MTKRKPNGWTTLAKILMIFNTVVLAMLLFLAGFYIGNKNSFLFESNRKGEIVIMRR